MTRWALAVAAAALTACGGLVPDPYHWECEADNPESGTYACDRVSNGADPQNANTTGIVLPPLAVPSCTFAPDTTHANCSTGESICCLGVRAFACVLLTAESRLGWEEIGQASEVCGGDSPFRR